MTPQTKSVEVLKNLGWGGVFNPRTSRPFAVKVNGKFLRTKSGAIRTFATRDQATKAGAM